MFFTSMGTGDDGDLRDAHVGELAEESWQSIIEDCKAFQESNVELIAAAIEHGGDSPRYSYDETRAGHDYWYTRNGHGAGYWDRGLGDIGDTLSRLASAWHEVDVYRGDDGLLYFCA